MKIPKNLKLRHPAGKRSGGRFTMTCQVEQGFVTFGILNKMPWVMVSRHDGESFNSIDSPRAAKLAAMWLNLDLWPAFARPLHPFHNKGENNKLF